jgi:hypothetical protein
VIIRLKVRDITWQRMQSDLSRPHEHASERVGFLLCAVASANSGLTLFDALWHPVEDQDYMIDADVGAHFGPGALRKVLQIAYRQRVAVLHTHRHDHSGRPGFSRVDLDSLHKFVPDFWNVRPELPHGALVLSFDAAAGLIWLPKANSPIRIDRIDKIGLPLMRWSSR